MANTHKFEFIKSKMEANPPLPFEAKYNAGTPGGNGLRRFWPHILGWSPDPTDPSEMIEMVLCYQYHPQPSAGWRCLKVSYLESLGDIPGDAPEPDDDMTPLQVQRQNCVHVVLIHR